MKRSYKIASIFAAALFLLSMPLLAQDGESVITSYKRNFIRANMATKIDIVKEAGLDPLMQERLGSYYEYVMSFSLQNADILRDDPDLIQLTIIAVKGVGESIHLPAVQSLWRVFMAFRDIDTRVAVLHSLSIVGKGDSWVIDNLNQFLTNQNNLYRSGMDPDFTLLSALIESLGVLGDGSSFPVLFSTMITEYPEEISQLASEALTQIRGDYKKYLIDVMQKNPPVEKLAAFRAGLANSAFSPADLGELGENGLAISLETEAANEEELAAIQDLRYAAVRLLTQQRWTRATPLVIKHFYQVQSDYAEGKAGKEQFLEAVECMGAMGSSDAAQALSLQLGLINSQMERSGTYDQELLLSLIQALGEIGDKIAFDYLLYIGYLPYPDQIQAAAREAMNKLKW